MEAVLLLRSHGGRACPMAWVAVAASLASYAMPAPTSFCCADVLPSLFCSSPARPLHGRLPVSLLRPAAPRARAAPHPHGAPCWGVWCQGVQTWLSGAARAGLVVLRPCRKLHLNFRLLRVLQCPAGVGRKPADWQVPAVLRDPWTWRGMLFRCAAKPGCVVAADALQMPQCRGATLCEGLRGMCGRWHLVTTHTLPACDPCPTLHAPVYAAGLPRVSGSGA